MRIDKRLLDWYEEINLTGLVESLADAQLFGATKGAFTGAEKDRAGIFEMAGSGHDPQGVPTLGAKITQGVVLLDEIGDLAHSLQPKLLAVLTGAEVFRVGGEGNPKWGYTFHGTTITATWRDPKDGIHIRPDLLSRIGDYVIQIPSVDERREDLPVIVRLIKDDIHRRVEQESKRLLEISAKHQPMDRAKIQALAERTLEIADRDIRTLEKHPWRRSGELRGIRQVLERALFDRTTIKEALDRQGDISPQSLVTPNERKVAGDILSLLRGGAPGGGGLSQRVKDVERRVRTQIREILSADNTELRRTAEAIGLHPDHLREQLPDIDRVRTAGRRDR
jgi:DNA-binding NtrC family response regulator